MNKMVYLIVGAVIVAFALFFFFSKSKNKSSSSNYLISTQGESKERLKVLSLDKPSEDATTILDTGKLVFTKTDSDENAEYKPDPELDWVIDLKLKTPGVYKKKDLWDIFDKEWRKSFSAADLYGLSAEDKKWSYVIAGDAPETYSEIKVAVNLLDVFNDDTANYTIPRLERYVSELNRKIKNYPSKVEIIITEPIEKAVKRGKTLVALSVQFGHDATIMLKGSKPFKGMEAWDALLCLGLQWGDGDLFHWNNEFDDGHDAHFSVWTTTRPGYFLPEDIQSGQMNPGDLVFGFSIPRSADPKNIYDAMLSAVKYCQKRLGGVILNGEGMPFDETGEKRKLVNLIDEMKAKGLIPGSDLALKMYR